jgi:hypothetical protein
MKPMDEKYWMNRNAINDLLSIGDILWSTKNLDPRKYTAESEEDFKTIFEREFSKSDEKNKEKFRKKHHADVKQMFTIDREYWQPDWYDDGALSRYIKFLENGAGTIKGWDPQDIALICIYTGRYIDSTKWDEILIEFNPDLKSGRNIQQHYNRLYRYPNERTNTTGDKGTDYKRLAALRRIIDYMEVNQYETSQAKKELDTFQNRINSYYK